MGAWAADAFGNDTACDWAGDFSENPNIETIKNAIENVLRSEEYLESDEASECLVACEILARLKDQWGKKSAYSEEIDKWVESSDIKPSNELINQAQKSISRILGENSELQELWDENEEWHLEMRDLLKRVSS